VQPQVGQGSDIDLSYLLVSMVISVGINTFEHEVFVQAIARSNYLEV
jgi:hypothetical protein